MPLAPKASPTLATEWSGVGGAVALPAADIFRELILQPDRRHISAFRLCFFGSYYFDRTPLRGSNALTRPPLYFRELISNRTADIFSA